MKELKIIKLCNCCKKAHTHLPHKYKVWVDDELTPDKKAYILGFHFDCVCGSSMFVKASMIKGEYEKAS